MKPQKIHSRIAEDLPINSVVAVALVPDPYSESGEYLQVLRSIRDDKLAHMKAHDQINEVQYIAGRIYQACHERATIGAIRAIDPTREAVDGSPLREFLTANQIKAFEKMREIASLLGPGLNALMFEILTQGRSIKEAAERRGAKTDWQIRKCGKTFKDALELLAEHFNLTSRNYAGGLAPP